MLGTYDDITKDLQFWMKWFVDHQPHVKYAEVRPIQMGTHLDIIDDCSGTVTDIVYLAGGHDPNGFNFNGWGNTTSIAKNCHLTEKNRLTVGDLCLYYNGYGWSPYDTVHISMVYKLGEDPIMMSHGWSGEPAFGRQSLDGRPRQFFTYPKNSRFPKPPIVYPKPHGHPSDTLLHASKLVLVKNAKQAALAKKNGWHLWFYSEGHKPNSFVPVIGTEHATGPLYVNEAFRTMQ
jgi:hypothetical protein